MKAQIIICIMVLTVKFNLYNHRGPSVPFSIRKRMPKRNFNLFRVFFLAEKNVFSFVL